MAASVPAELNVVVTGFSPWGSYASLPNIPINTSWQIAKSLPRVIFRHNKPNIRVLTYPTPIKTSWQTARETVPVLWKGNKTDYGIYVDPDSSKTFTIDAMVHLGMEDEDDASFSFEKRAFKGKYKDHDVDDKTPTDDDLNGGGLWDKCPDVLARSWMSKASGSRSEPRSRMSTCAPRPIQAVTSAGTSTTPRWRHSAHPAPRRGSCSCMCHQSTRVNISKRALRW